MHFVRNIPTEFSFHKPICFWQSISKNKNKNDFHFNIVENLTLETTPLTLLDRLTLLKLNRLFTARSKQQFSLELKEGIVNSEIEDLNGNRKNEQKVPQKAVIGIGSGKNYTLYDVETDNTQFVKAEYKSEKELKDWESYKIMDIVF